MLLAPKFISYERPEGHQPCGPDVLVRSNVVERFGLPEVDYDNYERLLVTILGFDPDHIPVTSIYHKLNNQDHAVRTAAFHTGIDDYSYRFGNTFHINADKRTSPLEQADSIDNYHVMYSVFLQGVAYALVRNQRRSGKAKDVITAGVPVAFTAGGIASGKPTVIGGGAVIGAFAATGFYQARKERIQNQSKPLVDDLMIDHRHDIYFPPPDQA